jgi:hypothetical protein
MAKAGRSSDSSLSLPAFAHFAYAHWALLPSPAAVESAATTVESVTTDAAPVTATEAAAITAIHDRRMAIPVTISAAPSESHAY